MKRIIKSRIFFFILGAVIFGSVGVVASTIFASNVTYDNSNSHLKNSNNQDVTTVQEAIDILYTKTSNFKKSTEYLTLNATNSITYDFKPNYVTVECNQIQNISCNALMALSPLKYSYSTSCGSSGSITINNNTVTINPAGYAKGSGNARCIVLVSE